MRANQIDLKLAHLLGRNTYRGQFSESSVDPVSRRARSQHPLDHGARCLHARDRIARESHFVPAQCHAIQLLESEVIAAQGNGHERLPSAFDTGTVPRITRYFSGKSLGLPLLPQITCSVSPTASSSWPLSRRISYENRMVRLRDSAMRVRMHSSSS